MRYIVNINEANEEYRIVDTSSILGTEDQDYEWVATSYEYSTAINICNLLNNEELKKASEEATVDAVRTQTRMSTHAAVDASAAVRESREAAWQCAADAPHVSTRVGQPLEYRDGYLRQGGRIVASEVAQSLGRLIVHRFNLHEELVQVVGRLLYWHHAEEKRICNMECIEDCDAYFLWALAAAHAVLKKAKEVQP